MVETMYHACNDLDMQISKSHNVSQSDFYPSKQFDSCRYYCFNIRLIYTNDLLWCWGIFMIVLLLIYHIEYHFLSVSFLLNLTEKDNHDHFRFFFLSFLEF